MNDQILLWTPRAKQRPRTTFRAVGGNYRTFTPRETVAAERALREQWTEPTVDGPVIVALAMEDERVIVNVESCAKQHSRKLRGDIDNYSKLILDALNGVAWTDDRHIVQLYVRKV